MLKSKDKLHNFEKKPFFRRSHWEDREPPYTRSHETLLCHNTKITCQAQKQGLVKNEVTEEFRRNSFAAASHIPECGYAT